MKRAAGLLAALAMVVFGCRRTPEPDDAPVVAESAVVLDEGCPHMVDGKCVHSPDRTKQKTSPGVHSYGDPLGSSPEVGLAELLKAPQKYHQKQVRVSGHVSRACSRKGCWMELAVDDSDNAERCRVTFKDYGFLVPTDSAGSHAELEGTVQVTQVKKDAVDHYESEGATFKNKQKDGSAQEVRLVATGVELTRT